MQDFESESLLIGGEHSQKVKAPPIKGDSGSRDCVDLLSPTAESRIMPPGERQRLRDLNRYEDEARCQGYPCIAGIDEAGRGPLAGPVVAAACIIPPGIFFTGIDDSKKLTADQREALFKKISKKKGVVYAIAMSSVEEIDRINIYQATVQAMLKAVAMLSVVPDILLVDGMSLPHPHIPSQKIIAGDALSQSIAAASILAKVTRDRLMCDLDEQWPQYGFKSHKGYATPQHLEALDHHGPCPIHRKSFEPIKTMICSKGFQQQELALFLN